MSTNIEADVDVEALQAELCRTEKDLQLAARYGKNLLEENEQLKTDAKAMEDELANLKERLESRRQEFQRSMLECKQTAQQSMSEMEQQLVDLRKDLAKERTNNLTIKDDGHRSLEQLRRENAQLRDNLTKAMQDLKEEKTVTGDLNKKLSESKRKKRKLAFELAELQKQFEVIKNLNNSLRADISALTSTCEHLNSDLSNSKEEIEFWEKKYRDKDDELDTCNKDLDDSQELLKRLQNELDNQSTYTPKSVRSNSRSTSLYDELSSSRDSLALSYMGLIHSEDMSSTCGSDVAEREDTCITTDGLCSNGSSPQLVCNKAGDVVQPEKFMNNVKNGWEERDTFQCPRCKELETKLASNSEELKLVSDQLLIAVQQKFKLQQQIEAWQTDMTQVVEQQVQQKLVKGTLKKNDKKRHSKGSSKNNPPERQLSYHMIKDSWVF